ncbi:MAG: hypothetical protein ACFBWO_11640 [Paracoccaceae bacterium]
MSGDDRPAPSAPARAYAAAEGAWFDRVARLASRGPGQPADGVRRTLLLAVPPLVGLVLAVAAFRYAMGYEAEMLPLYVSFGTVATALAAFGTVVLRHRYDAYHAGRER